MHTKNNIIHFDSGKAVKFRNKSGIILHLDVEIQSKHFRIPNYGDPDTEFSQQVDLTESTADRLIGQLKIFAGRFDSISTCDSEDVFNRHLMQCSELFLVLPSIYTLALQGVHPQSGDARALGLWKLGAILDRIPGYGYLVPQGWSPDFRRWGGFTMTNANEVRHLSDGFHLFEWVG